MDSIIFLFPVEDEHQVVVDKKEPVKKPEGKVVTPFDKEQVEGRGWRGKL